MTERLFATVNGLVQELAGTDHNGTKETKMNYTAAALAGAIAMGAACALPTATEAVAAGEEQQFPDWKGKWKNEISPAEVVDEAHIRMTKSETTLRLIGIARIEDREQAREASEGIAGIIEGKALRCWWLPKPAAEGNPTAVSPDGVPLASCKVRRVPYASCRDCGLQLQAVAEGYAIPEGGVWEKRTKNASQAMVRLKEELARAQGQGLGIWKRQ